MANEELESFSDRFRALIKGRPPHKVAAELGVSQSEVSELACGVGVPTPALLQRIAEVYKQPPEDWHGYAKESKPGETDTIIALLQSIDRRLAAIEEKLTAT
jgi:transcriptional regulator with XRE-family HTH domain